MRRRSLPEERCKAPPYAEIDTSPRVGTIGEVHVIPFLIRDHFERQLVVVPQKQSPLTELGNGRRLLHDLHNRMAIFKVQAHEDARHERKVVRHVAFIASPK
jgi:hypothetical protein